MEAGLSLFNKLVLISLMPTRLVGYEYKHGVPAEARTLVVVPSLIGSRDDVDESLRNLEVHFLANMIGDIYFALLSDWPDSSVELSAGDREVLDYARSEIKLLNDRHPLPGGDALPSAAPAPPLQRGRRLLDGLGAQARQAARAQPSAARRQRHDVPAVGYAAAGRHRPCDDARRRHAHDARCGDAARRQALAPAQPAAHRSQRPAASCAATASCSRASPRR